MKKIIIAALLLATLGAAEAKVSWGELATKRVESSDDIIWQQQGPGNAGFTNLVRYHPSIPGKLMICPDMWNAYLTDNNGERWRGMTDHDGDARFFHLRDLYFSRTNPKFALSISSATLWKSEDGGESWEDLKNCPWFKLDVDGTDKDSWRRKIGALGLDPKDDDVWYVAGGQHVRGQEWISCFHLNITQENPRGKDELYMGKLWKTENAGKTWKLINKGIHEKAQICRIFANPKNTEQLFAASNYGLYRSNNRGETWEHISKGKLETDIIMNMDYYFNEKTGRFVIYLIDQVQYVPSGKTTTCRGGVFMSEDEGESFKKINGDLGLDLNRLSGGVDKSYWLFLSKYLGMPQKQVRTKYPQLPTAALQAYNMIAVDPSKEGTIYLGFPDPQVGLTVTPGRLWKTENNGEKWISTARLYEDAWAKDKAYWEERGNPWNENMKVGHGSPHMRFGKNYAIRSMRGLDVGVDGSVMIISDHSCMLSTDRGETWQQMDEYYTKSGAIVGRGNSNLPGLAIIQDKRFNTTLLGTGEHRVMIPEAALENGDIPLHYIETAPPTISNMVFDPYNAKTVYATSNRQEEKQYMQRSTDGGWTWERWGVATPATNKWLDDYYTNGLLIDPINPQYMYFGTTIIQNKENHGKGGFFRSEDGGKTFSQSNDDIALPWRVNDVQFDPRDESYKSLFAAAEKYTIDYHGPRSESGGLYHSSDRGATWKKVKTPAEIESVQFVKFDQTGRMYITTGYRQGGAGVWYSDDYGKKWKQCFKYPGTESIDVSPYDRNLLAVSVRFMSKNPGVYLSRDRGETWEKCNTNITIPHQIEDLKFNIFKPNELWCATLGCGFYTGKMTDEVEDIRKIFLSPETADLSRGEKLKLTAKTSLKLTWHSENPSIASVSKSGELKAEGSGMTKIWAISSDGRYSDYAVVTVAR